jgi:glycerate 2-kinase
MASRALVALSNFKGTLTNEEATEIVASVLRDLSLDVLSFPFGDGGAGTRVPIQMALGGETLQIPSVNPNGESVLATVLCLPNAKEPETVFIESSQVCGFQLTPSSRPNPMLANSRGMGILLKSLCSRWKKPLEIVVGLGDSSISDVGMGMMEALGITFRDQSAKNPLSPGAATLEKISEIEIPDHFDWSPIRLRALCDVENPLCGPKGSARTFAPQKGANADQVLQIERGMENIASNLKKTFGRDIAFMKHAGSAGGLAGGLHAVFGAELVPGARFLCDWLGFDSLLKDSDFLVIGEGKTDVQTLSGKGPFELLRRARALNKKVVLLSGQFGEEVEKLLSESPLVGALAVGKDPSPSQALMRGTKTLFQDILAKTGGTLAPLTKD